MVRGSLGERFQVAAREVDRLLAQPHVDFTCERHVAARLEPPHPGRITGDVRFGKDKKLGPSRGHVRHMLKHSGNGRGPVEHNRRCLHHGDFDRHAGLPQGCDREKTGMAAAAGPATAPNSRAGLSAGYLV